MPNWYNAQRGKPHPQPNSNGDNLPVPPGGSYLAQWVDSAIPNDPNFTPEQYEGQQRSRLLLQASVACLAEDIPRRLGGEATSQELAQDKKFSKLLCKRSIAFFCQFGGNYDDLKAELTKAKEDQNAKKYKELRALAAQVNWHDWFVTYSQAMRNSLCYVATQQSHRPTDKAVKKACNRIANRLENELILVNDVYEKVFKTPDKASKQAKRSQ